MNKQELVDLHAKKPGYRGKLDAKCIDCIYDPLDVGTWRKQVACCTVYRCPLHPVRAKVSRQVKK